MDGLVPLGVLAGGLVTGWFSTSSEAAGSRGRA
jgi:hypothetical protein